MAGIGDPFENACVNIAVGAAALILNTALITKYGRRRVCLMLGLFLCGATQLVIAAVYSANPGAKATLDVLVGLTIAYTFCFNVGSPQIYPGSLAEKLLTVLSGVDCYIFLAFGRRATFATPPILYL